MKQAAINNYMKELKRELNKTGISSIHDALSDAEEHLISGLETARLENPHSSEKVIFAKVAEEFGTPSEIAKAYQEIEYKTKQAIKTEKVASKKNVFSAFFGILFDRKAWMALIFLVVSFFTGYLYLYWTVLGLSLSLFSAIFIFGIPLITLIIFLTRWLVHFERIFVETFLGVQINGNTPTFPKDQDWKVKFKKLFSSKLTWSIPLYSILKFGLGIMCFYVLVRSPVFLMELLEEVNSPILSQLLDELTLSEVHSLMIFLLASAGLMIFLTTLHIVKFLGSLHGKLAKFLLETE